ncbi:MAG: hypothetical protein Q4E88_06390 [Coriobacteriia bacterium]|nr:hypothetical protein [Coriobacteriia bacterium]
MATFTAHYLSPNANTARANGLFDFDSDNRLGSKALEKDARLAMLERFGNDSLPWTIDKIVRKKKKSQADGQVMFDFRNVDPAPKRKKKKGWW